MRLVREYGEEEGPSIWEGVMGCHTSLRQPQWRTFSKPKGATQREVLYVGNSDDNMKTARNGHVLFLNANWHKEANPYGYQFESPKDIARFVAPSDAA